MELPDAVRRAFEAAPHCFLATCRDGVPNVVPVGRKWIVDAEPHAAVPVSGAEFYLLDPGPPAGKRVL